jgi:FMN phosphatase YigB (HAD superfamily)
MVGDNVPSDIAGGRAVGMLTIWLDDRNLPMPPEAVIKVSSLEELHKLWLVQGHNHSSPCRLQGEPL